MTTESNATPRRDRAETREGGTGACCPHCGDAITGLTITGACGPQAWPCGHRVPARDADRLTGAGPAVAAVEDVEG